MTLVIHFPSENSILPNFSMLRGVAILDCDSHSQAGSTNIDSIAVSLFTNRETAMLSTLTRSKNFKQNLLLVTLVNSDKLVIFLTLRSYLSVINVIADGYQGDGLDDQGDGSAHVCRHHHPVCRRFNV